MTPNAQKKLRTNFSDRQADAAEDLSAVCAALKAKVVIRGADGVRILGLGDFHVGPWMTAVGDGELVTGTGGDADCRGTLTGRFDNVIVPVGATCTLRDATVHGNVKALEDARLYVSATVVRGNIEGDKAAIVLRVNDPFATMRFRIRAGDSKAINLTQRNPNLRMAFLGYQYNFGRPPKVRQVPEQTGGGSVGFGGPPG